MFRLPTCAALFAAALFSRTAAFAQAASAPAEEGTPGMVLRTYVNLVQAPVLVLLSDKGRMAPVDPSRFRVSIDSGPLFAPRHVHREGDDPLRLTVLVDESSVAKDEINMLPRALAAFAATSLRDHDAVSVAAADGCTVASSKEFAPLPEKLAEIGQTVIERAQNGAQTGATGGPARNNCGGKSRVWDSIAASVLKMRDDPSRRVLLVLTTGEDRASRWKMDQVRELAADSGVSVFAIRHSEGLQSFAGARSGVPLHPGVFGLEVDPLTALTELTGGMVMDYSGYLSQAELADELKRAISIVRDRYIIDYVRPTTLLPGKHSIAVSIGSKTAFIRVGGTTVPLPSDTELNDPDRLPSDHTAEPPVGTRRILK